MVIKTESNEEKALPGHLPSSLDTVKLQRNGDALSHQSSESAFSLHKMFVFVSFSWLTDSSVDLRFFLTYLINPILNLMISYDKLRIISS